MAHRAFSLRYLAAKLAASAEEVAVQMRSSANTVGLAEALIKGMEVFRKELTGVGLVAGVAMVPTLNKEALSNPNAVEKFLMRIIPRPAAQRTVFEGDVVAFHSPIVSPGSKQPIMVRRIVALEGDELVANNNETNSVISGGSSIEEEQEGEESYTIPAGYCWVLADNEQLRYPDVIDSRTFGPLPLSNIIGRVMYAAQSESNHGPIENSEDGMAADAAVLEAELDLNKLCDAGHDTDT